MFNLFLKKVKYIKHVLMCKYIHINIHIFVYRYIPGDHIVT